MVYNIPAPKEGRFFRLFLRFHLIGYLAWMAFYAAMVYIFVQDIWLMTGLLTVGGVIKLVLEISSARQSAVQLKGNGLVVDEACKLTVSEDGVLVEGEAVSVFHPWGSLNSALNLGGILALQREGMSVCYIDLSGLPRDQVQGIVSFAEAHVTRPEKQEGDSEEEDIYSLPVEEVEKRARDRAARQTAEPAPQQAPEASVGPAVPAPFKDGVATSTFSCTEGQVEEIIRWGSGRKAGLRSRVCLVLLVAGTIALAVGWQCGLLGEEKPIVLLVLLFLLLGREVMPVDNSKAAGMVVGRKILFQWQGGRVVSLNDKGSWKSRAVPAGSVETVRLAHSVFVYGASARVFYFLADADSPLPENFPVIK